MISKKILNKLKKRWHSDTIKQYIQADLENSLPEDKRPIIKLNNKTGVFEVIER